MPLDTLAAQRRVIAETAPDLLVLVESEFWPAQFAAAAEAGVPVVVVNATMSPRSFARQIIVGLTRFTDLFVFGPETAFNPRPGEQAGSKHSRPQGLPGDVVVPA